jgi:hypothetical protein
MLEFIHIECTDPLPLPLIPCIVPFILKAALAYGVPSGLLLTYSYCSLLYPELDTSSVWSYYFPY